MTLNSVLKEFDTLEKKKIAEADFSQALRRSLKDGEEVPFEVKAEALAFDLAEGPREEQASWGKYFGPSQVLTNAEGERVEYPAFDQITPDVFTYWAKRASESKNPLLKSRYLGLLIELCENISGSKPSYLVKKQYVEELLSAVTGGYCKGPHYSFRKLERALMMAMAINDTKLIEACKTTIIQAEEEYSVDDKPGLWGYCYDLLVDNKKVTLSEGEEQAVIKELEGKLERLTQTESRTDPWAAEAAAKRLADYYRKRGKTTEVKRVILLVGKAFERIEVGAASIQVSGWCEHVYKLYVKHNLSEEAASMLLRIREVGPKVAAEMGTVSQSINISEAELSSLKTELTEGTLEEALQRTTEFFIPLQTRAKEQLKEFAKDASLLLMVGQQLQDEKGRVVATVGPLAEDLDGHVVLRISQTLQFQSLFLRIVMEELKLKKHFTTKSIIDKLGEASGIERDQLEIIARGLNCYFAEDHLVAIHLLIPQIEQAIRNLIEWSGGNVLKPARGGGSFQLRTFDDILRDDIVENIFGADIAHYLRILFTDQRGWNLRNDVSHGMCGCQNFNSTTSDRIVHVILLLCTLKENK